PHILLTPTGSLSVTLSAEAGPERVVTAIERLLVPDGVNARDVDEPGVVGRMFVPSGSGPFPVVVTLSRSAGGLSPPPGALSGRPRICHSGTRLLQLRSAPA